MIEYDIFPKPDIGAVLVLAVLALLSRLESDKVVAGNTNAPEFSLGGEYSEA
jgi:hypothetical protein